MKQWSYSTRLMKYLMRTLTIRAGQPKCFDIRLMRLVPLLMAKPLSTTKALHLHRAGEKLDRCGLVPAFLESEGQRRSELGNAP